MRRYLKDKDIKPIILLALREDIGDGDVTSNAIFNGNGKAEAVIISKEDGIFCGGEVAKSVYEEIDPTVKVSILKNDGKKIHKGEEVLKIKGHTKSIFLGERTVLNFVGHMSGVATRTKNICTLLKGTGIKVLDTRKTIPGFRLLDKYSVKAGGGQNHRIGLYDMVLIKDNHIKAAGSITEAVNRVKKVYGKKYKIEVETTNLIEVKEAVKSKVDIIMLDNMKKETIKKAIGLINGNIKIDVSGNIDEKKIKQIADLKIDYISIGAITHSVKAIDLSMTIQ